MIKRDFKGVWIPKEIWLNDDLTWMEKLFLTEINSLDNADECYASNNHFAELFKLSPGRCSQIIHSLKDKKIIKISYVRDGKEIKKRVLKILKGGIKFSKGGIKNTKGGYLENDKGINTDINNTINNTVTAKQLIENDQLFYEQYYLMKFRDFTRPEIDFQLEQYSLHCEEKGQVFFEEDLRRVLAGFTKWMNNAKQWKMNGRSKKPKEDISKSNWDGRPVMESW